MQVENITHFVGIGGAGMSGLAKILLEKGMAVSGSDLNLTNVTQRLEHEGAQIYAGHNARNLSSAVSRVIISSAIPEDNKEVLEAKRRGLPVLQRAELLAEFMKDQKAIAVAGAHGKTTTTSMIAVMLSGAGMDPRVVVGGELHDIGGNARLGSGEYLVAEADESDGSFLKLRPHILVVTNVEDDHLDYYGSVAKVQQAFAEFLSLVPSGGFCITCWDDSFLHGLAAKSRATMGYSLMGGADYIAKGIKSFGRGSEAIVYFHGEELGQLKLQVPGKHNLSNAMAALAVGHQLGIAFEVIADTLGAFQGAVRRFQRIGEKDGWIVVDDYAHHPTEIKATLAAARELVSGRVVVLFQPHRFSRTQLLYKEFGTAFQDADLLVMTDIYTAGEKPLPGVSSDLIADEVKKWNGPEVARCSNIDQAVAYLGEVLKEGDLLLTVGAGDVWKAGRMLLAARN